MQSKLRKVLALLGVLAMLCTLLPLGAMSVAAEETNLLVNGDFEAGNVGELPTGWSAQNTSKQYAMTTTAQTHDGSYAAALGYRYTNFVLYQDVEVQANTRYTVTFWYKSTNTSSSTGAGAYLFGVYGNGSVGNTNSDPAGTLIDSTATEVELDYHNSDWTKVTYTFNSGSNTSVRVAFSPKQNKTNFDANSGSEFMYVDGVSMTAGGSATPPIVSWDFEDNDVGFTSGGPGQTIVVDPDDSTNHVLYWACDSKYGDIRKTITLEKNTDYVFNFKMKTSQGGSAFITVQTSSWGEYDQVSFNTKTEWTEHTIEFNTGDTYDSVMLKIQNNGTIQNFWVDDFTVTKKEKAPEPDNGETTETPVLDLDWEDGVAKFKYGSVVAEGPDGSNCFNWTSGGNYDSTYLTVNGVDQNAEYVISFKAKADASRSTFITIQSGNWANYYYNESFKPTTEWAEYTITTNVKDYPTGGSILFKFQDGGTATTLWIDDLTVAKLIVPEEEESDNLVINGDFETGSLTGWNKHQSTVISTEAHSGSYAVNLKGNGGWGGMLDQTISVTPGVKYTVSLWLKTKANGVNVQIKDGGTSGTNMASKWFVATDWTQLTWEVVPTTSAICFNFCGGGNGIAEDVLVDDITLIGEKVASDDGFIKNGDFETGTSDNWNVHGSTTVSKAAANSSKYGLELIGDGGWGGLADQNFATEIGHTYAVTFSYKVVANGVNIQVQNPVGTTVKSKWATETSWTTMTLEFTAVDTTTRFNVCGGGNGLATTVYMDDIKVVEVKDPNFDGYIWNGDFEAGSMTKWEIAQQTTLSTEAAKNGKYGAKLIGNGGWGGCLTQRDIAVEVGKTYKLSFWYKTPKNGLNMTLKDQDNQNTKLAGNYLSGKQDWTLYEVTFESGYVTKLVLNFSGSGKNTTDELWIDDIKLENLSGDEMDRCEILKNSGTSIRDVDDNSRGLAFRFFVGVEGAQLKAGTSNVYQSGTGTMKLFNYADAIGTLIEAGAIVSNDPAVGTGDMTMANVDGGHTIKVPAKHLTDLSENEIGFAVRIINIPDDHVGTEIYARPYYTYEINGEQVTVYGNITNENYQAVASVRRSLKILAIGNSFSVDAMQNYLYDVLKSADYDQVILGNLYVGGCSLDTHWGYISAKSGSYEFYKNDDNGKWVKTPGYDALTALQEETWDVITVQQASPNSGQPETYGNLQNIVNWIHQYKTNPNAKVLWHMTWAYQQDSTHEAFPNYGSDQMTMYNAIVNAAQNTAMKVEGIDGIIPAGTAIQNLRQTLGDTLTADGYHLNDQHGDYTASLTWYAAITGETLDLVDYAPTSVANDVFNIKRAVGRAIIKPYEVSNMGETVLISGSDFQASTWDKNIANMDKVLGAIKDNDGYELFDGFLFAGDYTPQHGHDNATEGIGVLNEYTNGFVIGNKVYAEGNHDAPTVELLSPYGNNDPVGGTYGVFVFHEEDYGQFGGTSANDVAADLKAYFDEKIQSGWDTKKPIFVMTHVPLHFNWRTVSDYGAGKNAEGIVEALNYGGEHGFNVIFLYGHNHSGDYDAYLGGASIYLAKGDTMLIAKPENYKEYQEVELKFTYLNSGYVGYFPDFGNGTDYTLSMTTFRIRDDGAVIITRYDQDGYTDLKAKGVPHSANEHNVTIPVNEDVYGPQRIVTATSDEEYNG